ncbi:MAG: adenylate/guanylate cyclase domain-containing protein [Balneolaceae bacterium]
MKSKYITYDFEKSRERLDDILNTSDTNFEEVNVIPSRDKLTFTNGFYVNCTALFVDLRGSSKLPTKYRRPTLARIYRSYISELVAIMNGNSDCKEISIVGDCVWGIFDSQYKSQIQGVFSTSAEISSLINTLNCKLKKKGIDPITVGIGIDYGRALMIKAGYSGSTINEVVWMGEVVNGASKLCSLGNKGFFSYETMVSNSVYINLTEHQQGLVHWNQTNECYQGNIINKPMEKWIEKNC